MKPLFWVTAMAVLAAAAAIENKPDKNKRQADNIRSPQNLQYSLVLPHSRVSSFRALGNRRISSGSIRPSKLPPYAVQMEPMVQYSQKDPLYDPNHESFEDGGVIKNEIQAQNKILNIHESGELQGDDTHIEASYGPPYGSLPTAPLYSHQHPHYYDEPEPIIEIIIKESNETLPAPPQPPQLPPTKKEPVQVFYVKYSKDPHSHDKVIYDNPIPAITPPSNVEEHHRESYVTVTPEPIFPPGPPPPSTTLRTIIKPESEVYHSDSGVKVTFGNENKNHHHHHNQDDYGGSEGHEETAPRPAIAYPQQPSLHSSPTPVIRSQHNTQYNEQFPRPPTNFNTKPNVRPNQQHAQSRIQFQQPFLPHEQQLPRQSAHQSFRSFQSHVSRQGPFGSPTPPGPLQFQNGPPHVAPGPVGTSFSGGLPSHQGSGQTFLGGHQQPGTTGPTFLNSPQRPQSVPTFQPRPTNAPVFHARPNSHPSNSPPRNSFQPGPPRTFHSGPQPQFFFNEPKYLQDNYHTITTEQLNQPKEHQSQNRPPQNFDFVPRPTPVSQPSPTPISQEEYNKRFPQFEQPSRPVELPVAQQLPQQRPPQHFIDNSHNRPSPSARPATFNGPHFQNYRPNQEPSGPPFHQQQFNVHQHSQQTQQVQQSYDFHQRHPQPQPQHSPSQPPVRHQPQFHTPESTHLNTRFPSPTPQHVEPSPSARPQFAHNNPPEQPHTHSNEFHQQNVGQLVPNGGELVAAIPKYEQHITVNGPGSQLQPTYNLGQPTPTPGRVDQELPQQVQHQFYDQEHEQVRQQLAQNVQKQQEEIQRLQAQLLQAQKQQQHQQHHQQQHQHQHQHSQHQSQQHDQPFDQSNQYRQTYNFPTTNNYKQDLYTVQKSQTSLKQYQIPQERSKSPASAYVSSTSSPYYPTTSRTVDITPTTQRYVSSTLNSINTAPEAKKSEKQKKPAIELPDEVPDDLRQQLLSSGILDNADISILDYDKIGDTSLDQLPPDQLANFFSAGGAKQIAASENRPVIVKPNGEKISARIDDLEDEDQESSASENIATVIAPPPQVLGKPDVEMKVVHFDPTTMEGQTIAQEYVKNDATRLEPVALNDKKYNRYLPLKVSGNQFPVPDILKGRKVTSVVVLAPVLTEKLNIPEHAREERATENKLQGIKFVAGDSLQQLLKKPSTENFKRWLHTEKNTAIDQQSVILLVTRNDDPATENEIYMFDLETSGVNKLSGDLSSAFVDAAENNSLSRDIEKLAIEGEGKPESFKSTPPATESTDAPLDSSTNDYNDSDEDEEMMSDSSDNVPLYVDFSSMKLNEDGSKVSISTGYSKTKKGRSYSHQ